MYILDTDIFSIAQHPNNPDALTLQRRFILLPDDVLVGTTIITYDEQTRGWFKFFAQARTDLQQLKAYAKLSQHLKDWQGANVFPFDEAAAKILHRLRTLKLQIGTNDLKIAAITLSLDATLITRNLQHFKRIPNLRVEDWTKP